MKNIIVLKDLPSNIIDEAIVILKAGSKLKSINEVENKKTTSEIENKDTSYEIAIKEAEMLVDDYMKNLEKPKENSVNIKKMRINYQKLKICSLFLGITSLIRNSHVHTNIKRSLMQNFSFFGLILFLGHIYYKKDLIR